MRIKSVTTVYSQEKHLEIFSEYAPLQIQPKNWDGGIKISMEGIYLEYFKIKINGIDVESSSEFSSFLIKKTLRIKLEHMLTLFIFTKNYLIKILKLNHSTV